MGLEKAFGGKVETNAFLKEKQTTTGELLEKLANLKKAPVFQQLSKRQADKS